LRRSTGAARAFAAEAASGGANPLDSMHRLMARRMRLAHHPEEKDAADPPLKLALRRARARDFAHIFIACARWRDPNRFVAGYRLPALPSRVCMNGPGHIPELGWVAFDATVPICRTTAMSASPSASTARTAR
jgi:hypothetical protein